MRGGSPTQGPSGCALPDAPGRTSLSTSAEGWLARLSCAHAERQAGEEGVLAAMPRGTRTRVHVGYGGERSQPVCQAEHTCWVPSQQLPTWVQAPESGAQSGPLLTSQAQRRANARPRPHPALLHATHLHKPIVELQRGRVQAFQEPWVRQNLLQGGRGWEGPGQGSAGRAGPRAGRRSAMFARAAAGALPRCCHCPVMSMAAGD